MGRKISIVSGKGGVGKTTIACGLGISLAKSGSSVCVLDLDIGLNNVDVLLGVENKVVFDLLDCLNGSCRIKQALVNNQAIENLYILPSIRLGEEKISDSNIRTLTDKLASVFDYVLIDAPAGMGENFSLAIAACTEAIVVVTPHVSSLRDADKVVGVLKGVGVEYVSILINRIRGDMVARKEMLSHIQIQKLIKTPLIGVVPESDDINIYSSFKFDKISKSPIASAFNILVHNIKFDKKIIYDYDRKYRGLLGIIRRNIKRSV